MISSFVDKLLQPIAQQQKSYLKDTTDFVNFIENTKVPEDVILDSMDVTSLYTNIPQEEGIDTVCRAYEIFYRNEPPIPTQLLKQALRLILQENSFQFNGKNICNLQTHGTAMGTKMAVAFSNIFMNKVETEILSQSGFKPLVDVNSCMCNKFLFVLFRFVSFRFTKYRKPFFLGCHAWGSVAFPYDHYPTMAT